MNKKTVTALFIFLFTLIIGLILFIYLIISGNGFSAIPLPWKENTQCVIPTDSTHAFFLTTDDYNKGYSPETGFADIESRIDAAVDAGFNSVIFEHSNASYDTLKDFGEITNNNKTLKTAKHISNYCLKNNISLYFVITPESSTKKTVSSVEYILNKHPVTGILLKTIPSPQDATQTKLYYRDVLSQLQDDTSLQLGMFAQDYTTDIFTTDTYTALSADGLLDVLMVGTSVDDATVSQITADFTGVSAQVIPVLTQIDDITTATDVFLSNADGLYDGFAINTLPVDANILSTSSLVFSSLSSTEGNVPFFDAGIQQTLSINYPAVSEKIYTDTCFIMGYSDPAQPLYIDDTEITRITEKGSFGVLVNLVEGNNTFVFTQGDQTIEFDIYRPTYSGGGGGTTPHDDSVEADVGQAIRTTNWISSTLTDPNSDSPSDTIPIGATAIVTDTKLTWRYGYSTFAYQIENGEYILARNIEFIDNNDKNIFTGLNITPDDGGEYIELLGVGTPISTDTQSKNELSMVFYNTEINLENLPVSEFFTSVTAVNDTSANTSTLTFTFPDTNPLWGYQVEYTEDSTKIYLKKAPTLSGDALKPLLGVTVMLDPGHGGEDTGALGLSGGTQKTEKDFNLAVSNATKYRLEQLGATVLMTRTDDTAVDLEARNEVSSIEKPDFFLSQHHNSILLTKDINPIHRVESYSFEDASTIFSQTLVDNIAVATNRELQPEKQAYFYVTRTNICPAVLFEYGFLVSPWEYELCADNDVIWASAFATAQSVVDTIAGY